MQLLKGETLVNIQVKQKPFMITVQQQPQAQCLATFPPMMGCLEAPSHRVSFSLLCHRDTQAAPGPRSEWETSLREEFLGHSHCCPIPWTPHDSKGTPTWEDQCRE